MTDQILSFAQKAVVLDDTGKRVLVIKYLDSKYLPDKLIGKLGFPGGQITFGEKLDESLIREVKEETGITIEPLLPFYAWSWRYDKDGADKQIIRIARLARFVSGSIQEPTGETETKLDIARWMRLDEIETDQFVIDERPVVKRFRSYRHDNPFMEIF